MVKPHMVKKWARPGTVHCRSLRWPATSVTSASALGRAPPGPVGGRLPRPDELGQPMKPPAGDAKADHRDADAPE